MSKLPLLIPIGRKCSSWFHRVGGPSIGILIISLLYGLGIGTGCKGGCNTTIESVAWPPCKDPCDQATLNVRIADPAGGKGPIELEPTSPVQGCPLIVKWASCYDETAYDPSTLKCTPATFPLTFTGTKERVTIVDTKTGTTVVSPSPELDDTIDVGCDGSRSYTWSDPKAGDYSVIVGLDVYDIATECDNQKLLAFTDLNTDNTQGVQFTVGCPCQGHESYDLRITEPAYDDATRHMEWSACVDWVACAKGPEAIDFDETIVITRPGTAYSHTDVITGAVTMGECIVRSYDIPAGVDAGNYQITVSLTAHTPFADCDPATATKNPACKQIPELATNNSSSISFTIK
jgi:hypothetical protein